MNKIQKIILVFYLIAFIFLSVVYVPYTAKAGDRHLQYYRPLWSPKHPDIEKVESYRWASRWSIKVNTSFWLMEIATLSIVCGIAFILFAKRWKRFE